jgi:hypothetical protein
MVEDAERPAPGAPHPDMLSDAVRAGFGVMRIGAGIGFRLARGSVEASTRLTSRLIDAARNGESAPQVVQEAMDDLRDQARQVLGLRGESVGAGRSRGNGRASARGPADAAELRRRGAELLRRSTDISYEEPFHPAYARILELLAPDEARILRLLAVDGPAAAVDVRATPLGSKGEMLAPGVSLIGDQAGCRFPDRVPGYLNNLYRLGLIWFSREPIDDAKRYEMLEAQPAVQQALKQARRTRTVRRSIQLTPFGEDFVRTCLPID